ncbi:MAG: ribbon-helix-helix domain-containing protein [Thermoproteota archaeon]
MRVVTLHVPEEAYKILKRFVDRGMFQNVSEAIRWAIIRMIAELEGAKKFEIYVDESADSRSVLFSFKTTKLLLKVAEEMARELGFKSRSEYLRYLIVDSMLQHAKVPGEE